MPILYFLLYNHFFFLDHNMHVSLIQFWLHLPNSEKNEIK